MGAKMFSFIQHPRWVVAVVIAAAVIVWSVSLYSIASQIGHPFPGFFYGPDGIVGAFTPQDFTGWQAGLRPWDRIAKVNGQHWSGMRRLAQQVAVGDALVYTVKRGDQTLETAVPTMEFTSDIMLRFMPGWVCFAAIFLVIAIFVYTRNPAGRLNRYLLLYLLAWALAMGPAWEYWLGQYKWAVYLYWPLVPITCVAGWIFFWSFPADRTRKEFLARWPLIPAFVALGIAGIICVPALFFLAVRLDQPQWWNLHIFSAYWGLFLVFAGGSVFNKTIPLLLIALRRGTLPLIRHQAVVLLFGIVVGLGGFIVFTWVSLGLNVPPLVNPQWGALITIVYPLSVAYAVLRYQLFDIRVVVRKGMIYSLLTASLTAIFLLLSLLIGSLFQTLTGQQSFLIALPPALLVAFLFQPARSRIQTFVDRAFFRREYEARQTLTAFGRGLSTLRDRDQVVRLVRDTVTETLGASSADLWLPDDGQYRPTDVKPTDPLPGDQGLAIWLTQERRPLLPLPDDRSPQAEDVRRIGATLAVPLLTGEKLLGILTLGEKRSGDLYTQDDLDLLTTLAHSAALALENARLHEERLAILRQRLAQVTAAQEEERQRIARELHDGVGPALASLNLRLRTARKLLDQNHPAAEEIEELAELAQTNIRDIRRLIYDLRPAILDELGLVAALREYVARCQKEHNLDLTLSLPDGNERLPAPLETALFRVIQEALANVIRHARAQQVQVALTWDDRQVCAHIADDGQGFDLGDALSRARQGGHLGLWSMRERVEQLGGQFEARSAPGRGTTVMIQIPLQGELASAWTRSIS